jgi:hypothetical protein
MQQGEDDGTALVPVGAYLRAREGEKPLGVYALYDARRDLQYVGYARNMTLAVKARCELSPPAVPFPLCCLLRPPWAALSYCFKPGFGMRSQGAGRPSVETPPESCTSSASGGHGSLRACRQV